MSEQYEAHIDDDGSQKTLSSYLLGFTLCVVLTILSFSLVQWKWLTGNLLFVALAVLALAQLLVQSVCFLRLNNSAEGRWKLLPFLFTMIILLVLVGGSLWIMYNLNYNMT